MSYVSDAVHQVLPKQIGAQYPGKLPPIRIFRMVENPRTTGNAIYQYMLLFYENKIWEPIGWAKLTLNRKKNTNNH